MRKFTVFAFFVLCAVCCAAQKKKNTFSGESDNDSVFFSAVKYREIGPFRGGRSGAVAGSYKDKNSFYFGATGGGVWKTTDGGNN